MVFFDSLLYILNEMSPYILLGFLIAGLLHAFVPQRIMSRHLSGKGCKPVVKAALAGIPLPLCSCGVLPAAVSLRRGGASKGASVSFLIATPQTGVDSIAATWSMLGPAFAIIRPVAALVTAFAGGAVVSRACGSEDEVPCVEDNAGVSNRSFAGKCIDALRYGFMDLVGSIGGWLMAGLVIAALISIYVPADFFASIGASPIFSMIAVLLIAVPMYVCATGSIPIAMSLVLKGLSPGTALVLLMAGPAVNFASFTLIAREMGRKTAWVYAASIVAGALAFGLSVDYVLPSGWFAIPAKGMDTGCCRNIGVFPTLCSAVLMSLMVYTFVKNRIHRKPSAAGCLCEYTVEGMNCVHCQATVRDAIASVAGVSSVDVNLSTGKAVVAGKHDRGEVIEAVEKAGFDIL